MKPVTAISGCRSPWTGILDYEPGIDELLGWVDEYDDENYGDDDGDDGEYDDFDDDDGAMLGFSSDEVQELLAQGVKPWDDDAAVSARYHSVMLLHFADPILRTSWLPYALSSSFYIHAHHLSWRCPPPIHISLAVLV